MRRKRWSRPLANELRVKGNMARSDETLAPAKPDTHGLESYRRLIELQKQMIELSQQYEQSKRERDALREEVARVVARQIRTRRGVRHRFRRTVHRIFGFLRPSISFNAVRPAKSTPVARPTQI